MPRRSVVPDKSPLNPSALRLKDLTVGKKILLVDMDFGDLQEYTVVEPPFVHEYDNGPGEPSYRHLLIHLRDSLGETRMINPEAFGIVRMFDGHWSPSCFVIDARKRNLFPDYVVTPPLTVTELEEQFWRAVEDEALNTLEREASHNWY